MDKFGLFNLLSALVSPDGANDAPDTDRFDDQTPPDPPQKNAPLQTAAKNGVFSADERLARAAGILERHNAISRRIDKKSGK